MGRGPSWPLSLLPQVYTCPPEARATSGIHCSSGQRTRNSLWKCQEDWSFLNGRQGVVHQGTAETAPTAWVKKQNMREKSKRKRREVQKSYKGKTSYINSGANCRARQLDKIQVPDKFSGASGHFVPFFVFYITSAS